MGVASINAFAFSGNNHLFSMLNKIQAEKERRRNDERIKIREGGGNTYEEMRFSNRKIS